METLHIKFDFNEAITGKRTLLSSQINMLNLAKKLENYQNLRKQELARKTALRTKLNELITGISNIEQFLPKTQMKELINKETEMLAETKKKSSIENELKEIREKLARLNI